jgi:RimJ/RimL family protein N-acetyltransferase
VTELRTGRLLLRPFRDDDEAFVRDLHARPEVMRYIGDGRPKPTLDEARQAIARFNGFGDDPLGTWAIEDADGRMHGAVLLKGIPSSATGEPSGEIEIGWRLHPDSWGRGIGSEAARRVLDHAWAGGLTRVIAVTHPLNLPSQRLAGRIGMRGLGETDAFYGVTCSLFAVTRPAGVR